jgi:phytoene dehydrogenase-like protein
MPEKSIHIIGGGVAGLAAGIYGQLSGFQTQIFELHDLPGGLCTSWERKGYVFDGCIHYLFGTAPGQPFNRLWQELGPLDGLQIYNHEALMSVVDPDGRTFTAYADPDRLEAHMIELSPEDAGEIASFTEGIRQLARFNMAALVEKPRKLMGPADWLTFNQAVLPFAVPMANWGRISAVDYAARLNDPLLRRGIPLVFGWDNIPMMVGMSVLAYMSIDNAGFPEGGSLAFARALERRYLQLGGQIHYKAQVDKILVRDDRAAGVRLYTDEEIPGDYVISACDGRGTIFELLGGRYTNRRIRSLYDGRLPVHSQIQVSLGLKRDHSGLPYWTTHLLEEPVLIAGVERDSLGLKNYSFDPGLAPPGKSSVVVALESTYDWWQRIYGRRPYDMEQMQVRDLVLEQLERLYPGFSADVELDDVATPVSYARYTGNWLGSTCGFLLTDKTMMLMVRGLPKTLPGLGNFYMAGQWVEVGGSVPMAAMSGRSAIQLICDDEGRPFVASRPTNPLPP